VSGTWVWDAAIRQFSPTYTIYAVTLPGFDGSKPVAAPLLDKVDASVMQLIEGEHLTRPVIIGHSLGGLIAFRFAERHADKIRGIVSIDGLPVFPPVSQMGADERAAAARNAATSLRTLTPEQFAKQQQAAMASLVTDPAQASQIARLTAKSNPAAAADFLEEDMKSDLRPALNKDTVPTLVLAPVPQKAGPQYPPFMQTMTAKELSAATVQFYEGLVSGAPHATVTPIANSLHFAMIDEPQAVNDAIAQFLKGLR
jgi:pimeloyl-ACP methyl ester carboxylesterase